MTNAILEPPTIESSALAENPIKKVSKLAEVAPRPAARGAGIGRINLDVLPRREITQSTVIQGRKPGLLSRSFHMLRDASFQIGLSHPGKLWYRESQFLNAKEKAVLDAALHGFL